MRGIFIIINLIISIYSINALKLETPNEKSNVWNSSIFRILVLFCIIITIFHIVIFVLYYLRIKINAYKNKITEKNEANNEIKLKVVNVVDNDNVVTNNSQPMEINNFSI